MKTLIIVIACLFIALWYVVFEMYMPTSNKLCLANVQISGYENSIRRYQNAEIKTTETIREIEKVIYLNKGDCNCDNMPINPAIIRLLEQQHINNTRKTRDRVHNELKGLQ